ncbi:MAG: MarR family transcriptional regulator [Planctomycetota bacterium]|nr:MarR family transcriptional regulator [Planctomycetota bacterium]
MSVSHAESPPTSRFDSPEQEAFLNLWRTYDRLRTLEDEFFRPYDLTPQQYNVLRLLQAQHPLPLATLDIANRLVSRAPDITRILDKLEQRGFVTRVRSEVDRRAVLVGIAPAGVELLDEMREPLRSCHERQLGHLPVGTLKQIVALLRQMRSPHETTNSPWSSAPHE